MSKIEISVTLEIRGKPVTLTAEVEIDVLSADDLSVEVDWLVNQATSLEKLLKE